MGLVVENHNTSSSTNITRTKPSSSSRSIKYMSTNKQGTAPSSGRTSLPQNGGGGGGVIAGRGNLCSPQGPLGNVGISLYLNRRNKIASSENSNYGHGSFSSSKREICGRRPGGLVPPPIPRIAGKEISEKLKSLGESESGSGRRALQLNENAGGRRADVGISEEASSSSIFLNAEEDDMQSAESQNNNEKIEGRDDPIPHSSTLNFRDCAGDRENQKQQGHHEGKRPLCSSPLIMIVEEGLHNQKTGYGEKIYTDWANHYLEKARSKRHIQDLQVDVTDGVILADVIEAVTNIKITEINRKPKTSSQMLDNIQTCLVFLTNLGVNLEGITSRDIRDGHLKSILSLFFQLSRFKQLQKQQDRDRHNLQNNTSCTMQPTGSLLLPSSPNYKHGPPPPPKDGLGQNTSSPSRLPSVSVFGLKPHQTATTSIPLPSTVIGQSTTTTVLSSNNNSSHSTTTAGKKLQEKGKQQLPIHHHHIYSNAQQGNVPVVAGGKPASGNSSRSTSPSASHSFIPTPKTGGSSASSGSRSSIHEKHLNNAKTAPSQPSVSSGNKSSSSSVRQNGNSNSSSSINSASIHSSSTALKGSNGSSSMLEKFKFFKDKDKSGDKLGKGSSSTSPSTGSNSNKRTSSSSGFSSARSERSDSSVSLSGDNQKRGDSNFYTNENIKDQSSSIIPQSSVVGPAGGGDYNSSVSSSTPKLAIKGFRQKLGKAITSSSNKESSNSGSKSSPKPGKKEGNASSSKLHKKDTSSSTITAQQPPSFLRQPKPNGNTSRNRLSSSGIPTRNSLIVTPKESEINLSSNHGSNPSSVHSSMSSIPGGGGSSTGVPKPTAAVKGTSKQTPVTKSISKEALIMKDKEKEPTPPTRMAKVSLMKTMEGNSSKSLVNQNHSQKPSDSSNYPSVAKVAPMISLQTSSGSGSLTQSSDTSSNSVIQVNSTSEGEIETSTKQETHNHELPKDIIVSSSDCTSKDSKVSPMSVLSGSGSSSSMGSLKTGEDSSGSGSTRPTSGGTNMSLSPNNNNSNAPDNASTSNSVIPECDEDDILLNVKPMEPLTYEYIKSPPTSGHQTPGFLSPKSATGNNNGGLMMMSPCMNGNNGRMILNRPFNPYGGGGDSSHPHSVRMFGLTNKDDMAASRRQYAASVGGENEYSEIDNFDINGGGYLSDGDLLTSNGNPHHYRHHRSNNDGYLSESGTSMYNPGRRSNNFLVVGNYKQGTGAEGPKGNHHNNNKHGGVIPEDSFDDSSSISSGISDLNEIPTDLTSSSVNSELSSPYASLQRGSGGENPSSNNKRQELNLDPQSIIYRVVGSRSHQSRQSHTSNSKLNSQQDSGKGGLKSQTHQYPNNGVVNPPPSSHKRSMNSLEGKVGNSNKKGIMIGLKEQQEYCFGQGSPNPSLDGGKRKLVNGGGSSSCSSTPNFGYVRRSTGCGMGGNTSIANTKYSIPVYSSGGSGGKLSLGMKEILTPEEFKAAHASLAMAANSPKMRTKVKVSGGTQTTHDLHEMSRHSSLGYPVMSEYASPSPSSRNSGSWVSGTNGGKSLSLTAPTASQLSQNLRERIFLGGSQSLPKGATSADYAALLAAIQHQQQQQQIYGTPNASKDRMSRYMNAKQAAMLMTMERDNSQNDTYANFSELHQHQQQGGYPSPYAQGPASVSSGYSWTGRHSTGYASSITSAPTRLMGTTGAGSMTEAESLESLSSSASAMAQHHQQGMRSNTLNQSRTCGGTANAQQSPNQSPKLNRSNSIRSTKSEKLYSSMLTRADPDSSSCFSSDRLAPLSSPPVHRLGGNQPPHLDSTSAHHHQPFIGTSSNPPSSSSVRLSMSPYATGSSGGGFAGKIPTKEDEINASSLSLVSSSSMYSSQEDKHAHEVRKLKRDLLEAQEKVQTLTNQLSTNAHVVAAFEQSLSNMTQRIHSLTSSAEQKDSELLELRQTIELLRKQSIEAGLTVASLTGGLGLGDRGSPIARQLSADSVSSINSISSACSCNTAHSHNSSPLGQTPTHGPTHNSSNTANVPPESPNLKKKNKGWLRSSFTKAFSRTSKSGGGGSKSSRNPDLGGMDAFDEIVSISSKGEDHPYPHSHMGTCPKNQSRSTGVVVPPPVASPCLLSPPQSSSSGSHSPRSNCGTNGGGSSTGGCDDFENLDDLKKQLREKEMVLTDIRLEALTSAHQLESLKETVNKMRNEMLSLKQDNERLQRMVTCTSLTSSQSSLHMITGNPPPPSEIDRRLSASEIPPPSSTNLDTLWCDESDEGKRILVTVFLGCHGSYERFQPGLANPSQENCFIHASECNIGTVCVSSKTKWEVLDAMVKRVFKDYLARIDPISNLGLTTDSILCYNIGEVMRMKDKDQNSPPPTPELLPCGYLVGDVTKIRICLKGATQNGALDALTFETLVPKSILQRYVTLLSDHGGRIIICGPSGTGKSYLARKLGEYLVSRGGKEPCPEAIATFSADHKNSKELRQYLANLAEQCENGSGGDLPSVIILDNLHQVSSFGEVFSGYLNKQGKGRLPFIIGTMTQSTASTPNLQLHQNFRWVLLANHLEPVKGILSRYLTRRLIELDVQTSTKNLELARIIDWIPKVWTHINKFLEAHNSSEVTIGPRLFLSCPTDVANSQAWFTDLWHYSIFPYLIEAVKEGLQLYGKKVSVWEDPTHYLVQTYPWSETGLSRGTGKSSLLRLRPEDVGYDIKSDTGNGTSPNNNNNGGEGVSETNGDPLMNMLLRLQEAANYSGPQSDFEKTSLDSRTSLDKDFVATA